MPSGTFEYAECCPAGYTHIDSEAECERAYQSVGGSNDLWGGNGGWSNRPAGCFRHTPNNNFHWNSMNTIGSSLVGDDEIICKACNRSHFYSIHLRLLIMKIQKVSYNFMKKVHFSISNVFLSVYIISLG